jgi:hypothetical protein
MARYYRRFIVGFSKIAKPMTAFVKEEISGRVAECTRPKSLDEEGHKCFAC